MDADKANNRISCIGNLAEMMGDHDKAINSFESALRHNPYSIIALSQIASIYRAREQFEKVKYIHL